jgi:hypothetical protein
MHSLQDIFLKICGGNTPGPLLCSARYARLDPPTFGSLPYASPNISFAPPPLFSSGYGPDPQHLIGIA